LPERAQVFAVQFIRFLDELLVKAATPVLVAANEQNSGTLGSNAKNARSAKCLSCAVRNSFMLANAEPLTVST